MAVQLRLHGNDVFWPLPVSAGRTDTSIDFWAPMLVFGVFTQVEPYLPRVLYPLVYTAKVCAVTSALVIWRRGWRDVRPHVADAVIGAAVGLVILAEWLLIDTYVPYPHFGARVGFNPFAAIENGDVRLAFIAIRLYGLVLMVPVMEEIFWRSFLLRYLTRQNFEALPIGTYSTVAFWIVALAFAAAHTEWLVAMIAGCVFAWLLRSTSSLPAAIIAHAVANAGLGAYILITHDWKYW